MKIEEICYLTLKVLFYSIRSESGHGIVDKDSIVGYISCSRDAGPVIMHVTRMAPDGTKSFSLGKFRIQKQKRLNSAQYLS